MRQPTDDFADQAWAMLMARLNNDRSPALQSEVHGSLVVRESTVPTGNGWLLKRFSDGQPLGSDSGFAGCNQVAISPNAGGADPYQRRP